MRFLSSASVPKSSSGWKAPSFLMSRLVSAGMVRQHNSPYDMIVHHCRQGIESENECVKHFFVFVAQDSIFSAVRGINTSTPFCEDASQPCSLRRGFP
jgi:hypothetical protein